MMRKPVCRSRHIDTITSNRRDALGFLPKHRAFMRSFQNDEAGSIAIIFALTTLVAVVLAGGAIDYGRAAVAREQIQNAVDSAALAAARVWQTENNMSIAQEKGMIHYDKNKPRHVVSAVSGFTPDLVRNAIVMEASALVPTPFLSMVRIEAYTVNARAEAMLAVGGNSETNLEISMMLDVTGSMAGSKITDLKAAAKDLIDIVVWADQSEYTSKVALVPFANAVNLGSTTLVDQVRGGLKATYCTGSGSPCTGVGSGNTNWSWGSPATWFQFTNTSGSATKWRASSYCVTERTGADKYTDAAPNAAARKVGPLYAGSSNNSNVITREAANCSLVDDNGDMEVNAVVPLSNDKDALKRRVDKLTLAGATAGQIGTAWAWYMLSPNWAYLWPTQSRPVNYNSEKTQKIAILMTDGEYNSAHCNGVLSKDSANNGTRINCNATNANSDTQADQMCAAMKSGTGITVYTVGFAIGGNATAINTLRNCASDTSKFYEAEDGDALRAAFRDIALQIARIKISQ